jgi:hypothetical protein
MVGLVIPQLVTYLVTMDRKTWERFKARLKRDGNRKVKDVIPALIDWYIKHGLNDTPEDKD